MLETSISDVSSPALRRYFNGGILSAYPTLFCHSGEPRIRSGAGAGIQEQQAILDTGFRRYDEFAASGGEYNPKGFNIDNTSSPGKMKVERFHTGIGATTWEETNIQVTIRALSKAPR